MLAIMEVTTDLLRDILHLPEDTKIYGIWSGYHTIKFVVHHDDIKNVEVFPVFKSHYAECGHVDRVEFLGWGDEDDRELANEVTWQTSPTVAS